MILKKHTNQKTISIPNQNRNNTNNNYHITPGPRTTTTTTFRLKTALKYIQYNVFEDIYIYIINIQK